jgi:hypothetical protein
MKDITILALASLATLGLAATQFGNIMDTRGRMERTAQSQQGRLGQLDQATAREAARVGSVAIANARFDTGCEVIVDLNKQGTASTIEENQPIIAGAYATQNKGKPLSLISPSHFIGRDVLVCDLYGTTALMTFDQNKGYAVAMDLATTNDRVRMAKARDRMPGIQRPSLTSQK